MNGNPPAEPAPAPRHYREKSPGRVAAARRLNARLRAQYEEGSPWPGGRQVTHGTRKLETMLRRGQELEGQVGQLLTEGTRDYLADLGGREAASNKEAGLCKRLAEVDLLLALNRARLITPNGQARRLTAKQTDAIATLHARLCDSYVRIAQALGLKRREKPVPDLQDYLQQLAATPAHAPAAPEAPNED